MTVTFESKFKQNENDFNINFKAPLLRRDWFEGARVIEFIEPEKKILNRFEFSNNNVLIISGPSSISLELDTHVDNEYQTEQGKFDIVTMLNYLTINENLYEFKYKLFTVNGDEMGNFHIKIEISE